MWSGSWRRDLQADNQTDQALQAWKDIAAGDPTDAEAELQIAEIDEHNGKFDDALAAVKKAHELASDSLGRAVSRSA